MRNSLRLTLGLALVAAAVPTLATPTDAVEIPGNGWIFVEVTLPPGARATVTTLATMQSGRVEANMLSVNASMPIRQWGDAYGPNEVRFQSEPAGVDIDPVQAPPGQLAWGWSVDLSSGAGAVQSVLWMAGFKGEGRVSLTFEDRGGASATFRQGRDVELLDSSDLRGAANIHSDRGWVVAGATVTRHVENRGYGFFGNHNLTDGPLGVNINSTSRPSEPEQPWPHTQQRWWLDQEPGEYRFDVVLDAGPIYPAVLLFGDLDLALIRPPLRVLIDPSYDGGGTYVNDARIADTPGNPIAVGPITITARITSSVAQIVSCTFSLNGGPEEPAPMERNADGSVVCRRTLNEVPNPLPLQQITANGYDAAGNTSWATVGIFQVPNPAS